MKSATKQGSRSFAWGFAAGLAPLHRIEPPAEAGGHVPYRGTLQGRGCDRRLPPPARKTVAARRGGSCVRGSKRRGAALLLVIFAVAFVAVLAVAVLDVAATDLGILRNHQNGLKALYAAQAGLNTAIASLRTDCQSSGTVSGTIGAGGQYAALIENNRPLVTVTSTGKAAGFVRTVQARVVVAGPPFKAPFPVRVEWWREVAGVSLVP